jgi:serine/threonine protein kinase
MNKEQYKRLQDIFQEAVGLETNGLPEGSMLDKVQEKIAGVLGIADEDPETASAATLPEKIGGYRILHKIGEGGMGTVYLAEQDDPNRRVALKVIRPDLLTTSLHRRFHLEVEVLGRLQHPGIAQILEAG